MKRNLLMKAASLALVFGLVSVHLEAAAQPVAKLTAEKTMSGGVNVYGQILQPQNIRFQHSQYQWQDLKHHLPSLLPDAQQRSMTASQVCDRFNQLNDHYLEQAELATGDLIYKMEFAVADGKVPGPADLALTDRLASPAQKDMDELLRLLPNERANILNAKEVTTKSLAMIMLYNAALLNCPQHAKDKGYYPVN